LIQTDVATLDPLPAHIDDEFALLFGAEADDAAALDPDAELIEPIEGGLIDLGETVAQQLSLAIDPYPRASGDAI
ncbi:MAG: YceD family protein, partial [Stellaceae bacterium]